MKMKKMNKLFLMALMGISALVIASAKVSAATAYYISNTRLYCDPQAIEPGGRAACYIVGESGGADAVHGFVVEFYTTDHLKVIGSAVNANIKDSAKADIVRRTDASQGTNGVSTSAPSQVQQFYCQISTALEKPTSVNDAGCIVYYSLDSAVFNADNLKKPASLSQAVSDGIGTVSNAVLGTMTVELESTNTEEKCGNVCFIAWKIPQAGNYLNYRECQNSTGSDPDCGPDVDHLPSHSVKKCEELKMKTGNPEVTETGSFVSYTILIAGILLAISAVAIAKKNNKLQKI